MEHFEVFYKSEKNGRQENQDRGFFQEISVKGSQGNLTVGVFVIADGMGGCENGAMAAGKAVTMAEESIVRCISELTDQNHFMASDQWVKMSMTKSLQEITRNMWHLNQEKGIKSGSTLNVGLILRQRLYLACVGDSPVYLYRQGHLRLINRLHNMAYLGLERGDFTEKSVDFQLNKNRLYQYMGMKKIPDPFVGTVAFNDGDLLVAGSDGAFGSLSRSMIKELIQRDIPVLEQLIDHLFSEAQKDGETDNQTLLVCRRLAHTPHFV